MALLALLLLTGPGDVHAVLPLIECPLLEELVTCWRACIDAKSGREQIVATCTVA